MHMLCCHHLSILAGKGKIKAIAAGSEHSLVLKKDGTVWATGYNEYGQLGDDSNINKNTFVQVVCT